jgi:hypothetical protein
MSFDYAMRYVLPGVISVNSIGVMYLIGNKSRAAFVLGLGNQCLWLSWLLYIETYGMLPTVAAMSAMYVRNLHAWR